jgi:hypothetical protein
MASPPVFEPQRAQWAQRKDEGDFRLVGFREEWAGNPGLPLLNVLGLHYMEGVR